MGALTELDRMLIAKAEAGLSKIRRRFSFSYTGILAVSCGANVVLLALSAFLISDNMTALRLPLLLGYAILAATYVHRTAMDYRLFGKHPSPDGIRCLTRSALNLRTTLRPLRIALILTSAVHVSIAIALAVAYSVDLSGGARTVAQSAFGLPVLLAYNYLICCTPEGR